MRKINFACSILLTIVLPLTIVILSSNLVLRTSAVYKYHFNDSQVMNQISYNISGADMGSTIAKYWSAPNSKKIQVYENNGAYKDPVFVEAEQNAMQKAKIIINIELAAGIVCLAFTLAIYIYLYKKRFTEALRKRFWVGSGITVLLLVAQGICWSIKSFRLWAYSSLIGIKLAKDSTLTTVLGDPFHVTYVLFASIAGVAVLAILIYVNHIMTKPDRIFY